MRKLPYLIFTFIQFFCKQSTGVPGPIQTNLQDPSIEVVTNHLTCDTKEVQKLLSCLNANKSCGDLLNWCRDYLTERQQRALVKGEAFDWLTVTSGVPQGSL